MCLAYFIQNKSFENEWMLFYFIQQIAYLHNCKSKTTTSRRKEIKEKKKKWASVYRMRKEIQDQSIAFRKTSGGSISINCRCSFFPSIASSKILIYGVMNQSLCQGFWKKQ